jgi:hypothetical protein
MVRRQSLDEPQVTKPKPSADPVAADGVKFLTSSHDRIRVRLLPLLHDDRGAVGGIR